MIKIKIVAGNQTHNLCSMMSAFFAAEINVPSDGEEIKADLIVWAAAAEKIVMDDAIVAPIYQASQSYLLAENVEGFEVLPFGRTINLRQAFVK